MATALNEPSCEDSAVVRPAGWSLAMETSLLRVEVCVWGFLAWLGGLGMQVGVAGVAWVLAGRWGRAGLGGQG